MSTTLTKPTSEGGPKPDAGAAPCRTSSAHSEQSSKKSWRSHPPNVVFTKEYIELYPNRSDPFVYEENISADVEKDLEKYQTKVEILRLQVNIDRASKDIAESRIRLEAMEKQIEPYHLEFQTLQEVSLAPSLPSRSLGVSIRMC